MKKKVLFIAPYRQTDGWGDKARALVAMLEQLCDLTIKPIWFNNEVIKEQALGHLEKNEQKNEEEFDILIQFGLPSYFVYDGRFKKNVAITSLGCTHKNIDISSVLNLFDKVAVFSNSDIKYASESGISPCRMVSFGSEPYVPPLGEKTPFDFDKIEGVTFYTTANLTVDSGLRETLVAYLSMPQTSQNKTMVVLTNSPDEVKKEIERIQNILGICPVHEYPKVAICRPVDPRNNRAYIEEAHLAFDVFVNVGYNATQCRDTLLAYGAGSKVIASNNDNFPIGDDISLYTVATQEEICLHPEKPMPYMYTSNTTWRIPVIKSIRDKMQVVLENFSNTHQIQKNDSLEDHTKQFKEILEDLLCIQ